MNNYRNVVRNINKHVEKINKRVEKIVKNIVRLSPIANELEKELDRIENLWLSYRREQNSLRVYELTGLWVDMSNQLDRDEQTLSTFMDMKSDEYDNLKSELDDNVETLDLIEMDIQP